MSDSDRSEKWELGAQLDRTIGFVRDCDQKTSIILTMMGVILTIVITFTGSALVSEIERIFETGEDILFILMIIATAITTTYGIFMLLSVLYPSLKPDGDENNEGLDLDSKMFFETVSKNTYSDYKEKYLNCTEEEFINDALSQIFINSKICDKKFQTYEIGFKYSMIGFVLIVITLIWGLLL